MATKKLLRYRNAMYRLVTSDRLSSIPAKIRSRITNSINVITKGMLDNIPLSSIAGVLDEYGYALVQEDDTDWSGFLLGEEGHTTIQLAESSSRDPEGVYRTIMENKLVLFWHHFSTGRYEVVAYIS